MENFIKYEMYFYRTNHLWLGEKDAIDKAPIRVA